MRLLGLRHRAYRTRLCPGVKNSPAFLLQPNKRKIMMKMTHTPHFGSSNPKREILSLHPTTDFPQPLRNLNNRHPSLHTPQASSPPQHSNAFPVSKPVSGKVVEEGEEGTQSTEPPSSTKQTKDYDNNDDNKANHAPLLSSNPNSKNLFTNHNNRCPDSLQTQLLQLDASKKSEVFLRC